MYVNTLNLHGYKTMYFTYIINARDLCYYLLFNIVKMLKTVKLVKRVKFELNCEISEFLSFIVA